MTHLSSRLPLLIISVFCSITLSVSAVAEVEQVPEPETQPDEKVLILVNEGKITEQDLSRYHRQRGIPKDMPEDQQRKVMLEELINRELIYQDALQKDLDKIPEVTAELELLKKNLIASVMLKNISESLSISDDQLKKEYDQYAQKLALQEYKARHILLDNENTAKDIIKKLDKGGDFGKLAEEYSIGPSNTKGGDLGWFKPGDMVKPFADAVIQLANSTYTKTPVKTDFGWHIILREDQRTIPPPSFDDMKDQIKMRVRNVQIEQYIQSLRNKAKIDRKVN